MLLAEGLHVQRVGLPATWEEFREVVGEAGAFAEPMEGRLWPRAPILIGRHVSLGLFFRCAALRSFLLSKAVSQHMKDRTENVIV